ncbi:uncharacterized protein LOC101859521 [Aplysia californica]|uniref:Uncharacterized protein LOC101859521 n=1 Tax=Aplysia californica TaxID=6500 RepID=A0ABM0K6K9_APLCA|nr:uncharacterized protein LOC101859521 [Aplysia californica]
MSGQRTERGILGLPKKKSILFSLTSRKGEEYPSDSDDSDYFPGRRSTDEDDEACVLKKAKKRSLKRKLKDKTNSWQAGVARSTKSTRLNSKKDVQTVAGRPVGNTRYHLPPEIWLRIFQMCVDAEGVATFVKRASCVCREWNQLSQDPSLYRTLDLSVEKLSLTRGKLDRLLSRDVTQCRRLSVAGQTKLQPAAVTSLLTAMPHLLSLDLRDCPCVKSELVAKEIPRLCPHLRSVDLSSSLHFNAALSFPALETLVKRCGERLVELRATRVLSVRKFVAELLHALQASCPNLEELDIRMHEKSTLVLPGQRRLVDMAALASACPKLRELRFDGFNFVDKGQTTEPLPNLRDLQFYSQCGQAHEAQDTPVFYQMFGNVQSLQELSISCSNLRPRLISRWVKVVSVLNMCDMRWREEEEHDLLECVDAWGQDLVSLDVSHNLFHNSILDTALCRFPALDRPRLRQLDLSSTNVTSTGVM